MTERMVVLYLSRTGRTKKSPSRSIRFSQTQTRTTMRSSTLKPKKSFKKLASTSIARATNQHKNGRQKVAELTTENPAVITPHQALPVREVKVEAAGIARKLERKTRTTRTPGTRPRPRTSSNRTPWGSTSENAHPMSPGASTKIWRVAQQT